MDKKAIFLFFNVGQGDATLLQLPTGKFMLIDNKGGGKINVMEYLKSILPVKNKKPFLDFFVLTHAHIDHVGSANKLFKEFNIGQVLYTGFRFKGKEKKDLPEQYIDFLDELAERESSHSDQEIAVDNKNPLIIDIDDVKFEFISPPTREIWDKLKEEKEVKAYLKTLENSTKKEEGKTISDLIHIGSIVGRITYMKSSVMMTGDSELLSWKYWIVPNFSKYCSAKLLHASHHGSKGFFISKADSDEGEEFDENTTGCYTDGLSAIDPSIVVVTNNTKPGEKNHESPPNEHAINLYKNFIRERDVFFTSDGTIQYVIPDDDISRSSIDKDKKFLIQDSESGDKTDITYIKPRKPAEKFPNRYGMSHEC